MAKFTYRVKEIADILSISEKTAYRMVETGEIAAMKVNKGAIRVRADVLAAYIDRRSQMFVLENGFKFIDGGGSLAGRAALPNPQKLLPSGTSVRADSGVDGAARR